MTLVVSSHILAELEDYSDRMVIVDHGRIAGGESIALKDGDAVCASVWRRPRKDLEGFPESAGRADRWKRRPIMRW